jgi:hypothetical protein
MSLADRATSVRALAAGVWDETRAALDRGGAHVGLGTASRTASVWPVLGVGFLVIALIADRIHSSHAVPVRWLVVLLVLGAVVVAGQLREGGRLRALESAPAAIGSPVLLTGLALLLAAQQADFLSLGVTQVAWFLALVCVAIPLIRDAVRSRPAPATPSLTAQPISAQPMTALRQSAPLLGAGLSLFAVITGWLPGQYGPGWFWTVVLVLAAVVAIAAEISALPDHRLSVPAPVLAAGFWVLTALVAGVAVASARLEVTSVLWLAAALVLIREAWRRLAAAGGPVSARSRAGIALAALGIAVLSLFGTTNSLSSGGYFMGGLSYDPYAYDADSSGYYYNPTEYYQPGLYFEASGRGQPYSIPIIAGLFAMAGAVRRRRMTPRLRVAAVVMAVGAVVWAAVEGSASYLSVWVFIIAVLVAGAAAAVTSWPRRSSASSPAPQPSSQPSS